MKIQATIQLNLFKNDNANAIWQVKGRRGWFECYNQNKWANLPISKRSGMKISSARYQADTRTNSCTFDGMVQRKQAAFPIYASRVSTLTSYFCRTTAIQNKHRVVGLHEPKKPSAGKRHGDRMHMDMERRSWIHILIIAMDAGIVFPSHTTPLHIYSPPLTQISRLRMIPAWFEAEQRQILSCTSDL